LLPAIHSLVRVHDCDQPAILNLPFTRTDAEQSILCRFAASTRQLFTARRRGDRADPCSNGRRQTTFGSRE
jgi:hypothetical protein